MSLTIALPAHLEASLRIDADRERRPVEEVASRRLEEALLLNQIFSYFPSDENRVLRSLAKKRQLGTLDAAGQQRFRELVYQREIRNAERLADIAALAKLRNETVRDVMSHFGIRPIRIQ